LVLPPTFAIVASGGSFTNDVLESGRARYAAMINGANGPTTVTPPGMASLAALTVTVASGADAALRFGVDESYVLNVSAAGATLAAPTVWGALRGLETMSQLARHAWTTNDAGAVNASFNEICAVTIVDAPRFPVRALMLDTSRHVRVFLEAAAAARALRRAAHPRFIARAAPLPPPHDSSSPSASSSKSSS
jgi:hexosaminidase